ncbi:MAG: hypothetical protein ACPGTS_00100 [Minisyncoccia bacterium]
MKKINKKFQAALQEQMQKIEIALHVAVQIEDSPSRARHLRKYREYFQSWTKHRNPIFQKRFLYHHEWKIKEKFNF